MCGIAGYSLSPGSPVDRTLAAQALLAGIAERGADAVGYAFRAEDGAVGDHQAPGGASALLDEIAVPPARGRRSSTCATTRRAIPRSPPTTTPSGMAA